MTTPDQPQPGQLAGFDQTHAAIGANLDDLGAMYAGELADGHNAGLTLAGLAVWLLNASNLDASGLADHLAISVQRLHDARRQLEEAQAAFERGVAEGRRQATEGAVVEHALAYKSGDMQVRWSGAERIYPLAEWIPAQQQNGGKVHRRTVIVVEDWAEVAPAEQARPTCTCPMIDVTIGGQAPSFVQGYDPACPACPNPYAKQDGADR